MVVMDKRGFQLAISTIVLMVLAVLILIGLISMLTMGWDRFIQVAFGYVPSEQQISINFCEEQCTFGQEVDFCCGEKQISDKEGDVALCLDLGVECPEISCGGVCGALEEVVD
jgi:hypothetical protein